MSASIHLLAIGQEPVIADTFASYTQQRGWRILSLQTVQQALRAMRQDRFDTVLALESLADGRGYDLAAPVSQQSGNLFVGVPLSEGHLWLPVVQGGKKVLGMRGVGPLEIRTEIERLLDSNRLSSRPKQMTAAMLAKGAVSTGPRATRMIPSHR